MIDSDSIIIQGVTEDGRRFRPSDWVDRISSHFATYRLRTLRYNPMIVPGQYNGVKCLVVDKALKEANPQAWDYLMHFAQMNKLVITDGAEIAANE